MRNPGSQEKGTVNFSQFLGSLSIFFIPVIVLTDGIDKTRKTLVDPGKGDSS